MQGQLPYQSTQACQVFERLQHWIALHDRGRSAIQGSEENTQYIEVVSKGLPPNSGLGVRQGTYIELLSSAMQQPPETMAFKQVASIERLVNSARGVRTPCLYYELKHLAINRDSDWRFVVRTLSRSALLDRIRWCEVFVGDIVILRRQAKALEQRTTRLADLRTTVGSSQHVEAKVRMLLVRGENAVAQSDVCEDVLLRALRRLSTLVEWSYSVSRSCSGCFAGRRSLRNQTSPAFCRAACACTQSSRTGR